MADTIFAKDNIVDTNNTKYPVVFYFQMGGTFSLGGENFFETYRDYYGGEKSYFDKTPKFNFGARIIVNQHWRLNASAGYFSATIDEFYSQNYENSIESGTRLIDQSFRLTNIPLTFSVEYVPFDVPYKTFVGAGLGMDVGNVKWNEMIQPGSNIDKREGGDWSTGTILSPVINFSTGINLLFDRHHPEYILHNFLIELRYSFIYRNRDIFVKSKNQFIDEIPALSDSYYIYPSYIELNFGFSLNFEGG